MNEEIGVFFQNNHYKWGRPRKFTILIMHVCIYDFFNWRILDGALPEIVISQRMIDGRLILVP